MTEDVAVRSLLAEGAERLAAAGIATPRVDAELLLADLLDIPRSRLRLTASIAAPVAEDYRQRIARRIVREPLQYITGTAPFRHIELAVGPGVFIPRPETELLVEAVLPHVRGTDAPLVVDLCAGSGALALAVADEVPGARVIAVEASPAAADWLTRNVLGSAVDVIIADITDADALAGYHGQASAVVANPPYVPAGSTVAPEVRADPAEAVFAGPDGLDLIPSVVARAAELLADGGILAVEHDESQHESVPGLMVADGGWCDVLDHRDLSGRPRFTTARRCMAHR